MTQEFPFQPGTILHAAVVGAFKATGGGFETWCSENSVTSSAARSATFGQSKGPMGRVLLARMIEAAGPEVVRVAYLSRLRAHLAEIEAWPEKKGAA